MKLYFPSRDKARSFSNTVKANGTPAKLHDSKEKGEYSVNGSRFAVEILKKVV